MKKIILILGGLLGLLVASGAFAGPDMVQFTEITSQTNGATLTANRTDNDVFVSGWVDTVIVDHKTGAGTSTNQLVLATLASQGTGPARPLLTLTATADGVYPIRDLVTGLTGSDISNVPARVPLVADKLTLTCENQEAGGTSALTAAYTVYVVISPVP